MRHLLIAGLFALPWIGHARVAAAASCDDDIVALDFDTEDVARDARDDRLEALEDQLDALTAQVESLGGDDGDDADGDDD